MADDLGLKLESLRKELLALKAKQGYTSVRTASFWSQTLSAGTHTINYESGDQPIITFIYAQGLSAFTIRNVTTPTNDSQTFDVSYEQTVQVISTRKILSVN